MQASKAADTYGLFKGHGIQQADAKQAYTQSKLGGTPTLVFLPKMNGLNLGKAIATLSVH